MYLEPSYPYSGEQQVCSLQNGEFMRIAFHSQNQADNDTGLLEFQTIYLKYLSMIIIILIEAGTLGLVCLLS